jgi:hypothetical protein
MFSTKYEHDGADVIRISECVLRRVERDKCCETGHHPAGRRLPAYVTSLACSKAAEARRTPGRWRALHITLLRRLL